MDFKLKSLREWVAQQSSQKSNEATTGQSRRGVAIYCRSLPRWEMTILDTRSSQWPTDLFTTVGFSSNGNITWGTSNANSSVRVKSLAAKKITVSCWQVFARSTKRFLSQLSWDLGLASENQSFKRYTPLNNTLVLWLNERRRRTKQMLRLHFVFILPRTQSYALNRHRTNCLIFNNF